MLSISHQLFLLEILKSQENNFKKSGKLIQGLSKNNQNIWNSIAFYRNTGYLEKANLIKFRIEKNENKYQYKIYELTSTGSILVRCLLLLPDIRKKYPDLYKEYKPFWVF